MHEASLAEGLLNVSLDSIQKYSAAHPDTPITRIAGMKLGLGLLSCVEIETFKGCFSILAEGTPAEGASLEIEVEPLPCTCRDCGKAFELHTRRHFACPECGGNNLSFSGGHGLTLLSLEVGKEN